jgi:hypothetical protein
MPSWTAMALGRRDPEHGLGWGGDVSETSPKQPTWSPNQSMLRQGSFGTRAHEGGGLTGVGESLQWAPARPK